MSRNIYVMTRCQTFDKVSRINSLFSVSYIDTSRFEAISFCIMNKTFIFLRTHQVIEKVGLSRQTIWRLEKEGKFPQRRQLGAKSVGWLEEEVHQWMESRIPANDGGRQTSAAKVNE